MFPNYRFGNCSTRPGDQANSNNNDNNNNAEAGGKEKREMRQRSMVILLRWALSRAHVMEHGP